MVRQDAAVRLAWIPILLSVVLIPVLWMSESHVVFESLPLAIGMNMLGRTVVAMLIAVLVGRSFLVSGRPELLLLGCGVGIWGAASSISIMLAWFRPDSGMTVAALGVFLSGACHMIGVYLSTRPRTIRNTVSCLVIGYSMALIAIAWVAMAEIMGKTPIFFVEASGGTAIRHVVLGSTVAMFLISAIMLQAESHSTNSSFTRWYSYALLMIAAGQMGMMIESSRFTMLGWMCRVTQVVGGLYMLIAVLSSFHETGSWGISLRLALRDSEERFRLFMDNSPTIAWIKDAAGRNIYANKTFLGRFHFRREDIAGKTDDELSPVENAARYHRRDIETLEADHPIEYLEQLRNPDGTVGDWIVIKFPLRDSGGMRYVAGIGLEVTERLRAEEELRRSREEYHHLVEGSRSVILRVDSNLHITYMNQYGLRFYGYAQQDVIGRHLIGTIMPPRDEKGRDNSVMLADFVLHPERYGTNACQCMRRDGTLVWMTWANEPIYDGCGDLVEILSIGNDISKLKESEDALRQSEERMQMALRISHSFSFAWDAETDRVMHSESCGAILGPEDKCRFDTGTCYIQRIHPEDREEFVKIVTNLHPDKDCYQCQYRIARADGTYAVLEETARASFGPDGKTRAIVGVATDITERKRAEEELKELNQALEQRVGERTRELKNTIRQLQVLAQKLTQAEEHERGRLAEVLHDDLQQVLVAAKLYLARVRLPNHDSGTISALIEDTDHLIDEAILITRNLSHELSPPFFSQQDLITTIKWLCWQMMTKYELTVRFSGDEEININDTLKVFLFRAAREILFNVVKHANVREAELGIRHVGPELEMVIADHGKGFDTEKCGPHSWFESGFGLYSIKERARLMGGRLQIDSAPGRGSAFKLTVPLEMFDQDTDGADRAARRRPPETQLETSAQADA